ncbi:hypothetical protein [Nonomuraea sp. NPDC049028]|uniref:hypothetical protein n=1 Tax=Nonomuraea sp. NPDC049028 TaxID=3364348 RepID=UPI003718B3AA
MTDEIYPNPTCECGACPEEGQTRCRKCLARERWAKRRAGKRKNGRQRGETRRPPRTPRGLVAAGVTWT